MNTRATFVSPKQFDPNRTSTRAVANVLDYPPRQSTSSRHPAASRAAPACRCQCLASNLGDGLDTGGLRLVVQRIAPVQPPAQGDLPEANYYEVLIRRLDENGQFERPASFLPALEARRLAVKLDEWVIDTTLEHLASPQDGRQSHDRYSVNVSGQSMGDETFLPHVVSKLARTGIAAERLCFELTETTAINNWRQTGLFMRTLRALGSRFSLDDFGTGYCSFAYLKRLPVDFLKIDGEFVRDLASDPMDFAMVKSINELAHILGKQTVAEYVESEEILDILSQIGVDYAQGYAIGRPLPMEHCKSQSVAA
ncbi:MAG: EAL domain-containing protein [Gammaproteobacteria bacterium]